MKMKLLGLALLAAGAVSAQVSIGITIGAPPPPRVIRVRPISPAPEYLWIEGYWYPVGHSGKYRWHEGYWTRPPYSAARWIAPRYDGRMYFEGYWDGDRQVKHDHKWDKGHGHRRDWDRDRR